MFLVLFFGILVLVFLILFIKNYYDENKNIRYQKGDDFIPDNQKQVFTVEKPTLTDVSFDDLKTGTNPSVIGGNGAGVPSTSPKNNILG